MIHKILAAPREISVADWQYCFVPIRVITSHMPNIFEYSDYRQYLKDVIEQKKALREGFSLRLLAKNCKISVSTLSRILNNERTPSISFVYRVSRYLDLTAEEILFFLYLVDGQEHPRGEFSSGRYEMEFLAGSSRRTVDQRIYQIFRNWYCAAIFEMASCKGFDPAPKAIAKRLGITSDQVKFALGLLVQEKFLFKKGSKYFRREDYSLETEHDIPSNAINENHQQHLHLAARKLQELSPDSREYANVTLAIREDDIPRVKRRMRHFFDRFIGSFEAEPGRGDCVGQLNMQFLRLT